ncbi:MAG TPA: M28 family peptidase [Rubricoccaceae bacterium]|nr:M28 family peptidase [Rubricoccaceae bacterium]
MRCPSFLLAALFAAGCTSAQPSDSPCPARRPAAGLFSAEDLLGPVRILAADSMEGRAAGTPGGARARRYLVEQFAARGLRPFGETFEHPFEGGVNVVGWLEGTEHPDRYLVLSAHYDHMGVMYGQIYNGADDNASGVSVLLALADYFREHPPRHSLLFAAFDAEEQVLVGARAFVADPPVPLEAIRLNVNLDMVSRGDGGELWIAGMRHYPALRPILEPAAEAAPVCVRFGHDDPALGWDDWTASSDHGAFHQAGIPFVYFGVEDHVDYHRPTDDVERIQPAFFVGAAEAILGAVRALDAGL